MRLIDRACPVCGSTERSQVLEANFDESKLGEYAFASRKLPEYMHFSLVSCPTCDLLYASPMPELDWLRAQYREAGFSSGEESRYAALTYARHLPRVLERLPARRAALDIGAGDGAFVEQLLAAGFARVQGIEPSRAPLEQARPEIRRHLREGFFRAQDFEPGSFSLVTCFQTLEHTDDPAGLCAASLGLLEPGGAFYVVAHNRRSVSARLLKHRSPIYDIEHLQLHSPASLRTMFERAGFVDVHVAPLSNAYPLAYWVKLLPIPAGLKKVFLFKLDFTRLGKLVIPLRAGNLIGVGYKPRR